MTGSGISVVISPSLDRFVINCTTVDILDDNFAETTESLTIELMAINPELYVVSEVGRKTVINIFDDEGEMVWFYSLSIFYCPTNEL